MDYALHVMSKLCLIIIDGFGVAPSGPGNARELAKTPFIDKLEQEVPNCLMDASGEAVGLPAGQQGASEPGHLTIGAGRVVWQPLSEIARSISSNEFYNNQVLVSACDRAKEKKTPLHLIGLYSSGGVHSSIEHFHAMLKLAKDRGVEKVYLHLFGDGRDVEEQYFCTDFDLLKKEIDSAQIGIVASLVGRYFAMDRDKQYADRTKVAYDLLVNGEGEEVDDLCAGAASWYLQASETEDTDYYIRPLKTPKFESIKPEDTVVCVNFRSDRMIQIVRALEEEDFSEFPRPIRITDVTCMGPYSDHLPVAYPAPDVKKTLGEVVSDAGLKQLRIAETDKFAHVTFFFNSQKHDPFSGEDRILIESPKVSNYSLTPKMSAHKVADTVLENVEKDEHDLIIVNFANPDLVGHGGDIDAAVQACETVDQELQRVIPALNEAGYDWIVTADHGNAESMFYEDGKTICPSHTANQVQTFVNSNTISGSDDLVTCTGLKDIAPLCLNILGIEIPKEMKRNKS
jgi:2,3-bisphosphoglycerate-independent phosphoglycerate mutase